MSVALSARCGRPGFVSLILASVLLNLVTCVPSNRDSADSEGRAVAPGPKAGRSVCESGMTLEVTQGSDGGIVITADSLDEEYVTREDAWKTLPRLYKGPLTGVPEPVEVVPEELSTPELMLLDGFCCCWWGKKDEYRHIRPLLCAVGSILMIWDAYEVLPSGDYALLFPKSPPTDSLADMFWSLPVEQQRHTNAVPFFNPLRGSVIRVNPPEEKSPGDIYLQPLELSDSQLAEIEPFLSRHRAAPSPAFLFTVHGIEGNPLLRGVWFIHKLDAHSVHSLQRETDSASGTS